MTSIFHYHYDLFYVCKFSKNKNKKNIQISNNILNYLTTSNLMDFYFEIFWMYVHKYINNSYTLHIIQVNIK